jgi:hypothetical protein
MANYAPPTKDTDSDEDDEPQAIDYLEPPF